MMPHKPLLLKDFLLLDANSDSCDNFASFPRRPPTVRGLIADDRRTALTRTRSQKAFTKLSSLINAAKLFTSSRKSDPRFLTRSFSKKLGSLFQKRQELDMRNEERSTLRVRVRDIVRMKSFQDADVSEMRRRDMYLTAPPLVSSSSGSSEDGEDRSDFLFSCGSSVVSGDSVAVNSEQTVTSKEEERECHSEEEKEQLSPVSVMDFPFQEEDNEEEDEEESNVSPCFQQTLDNIERTRHQLLQKLRKFESLAELDLDPVNLDTHFASYQDSQLESNSHVSSDVEDDVEGNDNAAWDLLDELKSHLSCDQQESSSDQLLLNFFSEGLSCLNDSRQQTRQTTVENELLKKASEWMCNGVCKEAIGVAHLKEVERSGDWARFDEGVDEVAADMEDRLVTWLVDELVLDLVSC